MQSKILIVLTLLTLLLALLACGGGNQAPVDQSSRDAGHADEGRQATPSPLPAATMAVAGVTLIPYTGKGFSGVVPSGWTAKQPGEFWRGAAESDPTLLLQQAVPGVTMDLVIGLLAPKLGLETFPQTVGHIQNRRLSWDLYALEREDPQAGAMAADIALAQDVHGVYLVLLITTPDEYEALHYGVFLRALDGLTPLAAEAAKDTGQPREAAPTGGAEVLLIKGEQLDNEASDTVAGIVKEGLGLSTAFVDLEALGDADLGVKLIFVPGGECGAVHLSDQAARRVREAVAAGTGYIGTCCGAFLAAEGVAAASHLRLAGDGFGIFPGLAEWGGGEGTWPFYIDVTHPLVANSTAADRISAVTPLRFVGGTSNLLLSYGEGLSHWRVATLDDPNAGRPGGRRAALTATLFGRGRVFLSGAHPEAQAASHPLMLAAVEWCTRASDPATSQSPVIVANIPVEGVANRFFSVSAAGSHDPEGYPVGFVWDFGDGSPRQYRPEAIHIYEKPGTYTLTLTVTTGRRDSTQSTEVRIDEP